MTRDLSSSLEASLCGRSATQQCLERYAAQSIFDSKKNSFYIRKNIIAKAVMLWMRPDITVFLIDKTKAGDRLML